jgi:CBS domain-containing protein
MVREAAEAMQRFDVGILPVLEYSNVVGVVTDRDIVRAAAAGKDSALTVVKDIMSPEVLFCSADSDIQSAAELMKGKQVRRLLVLNGDNNIVGVLSLGDLASKTNDEHLVYEVLRQISEPKEIETMT